MPLLSKDQMEYVRVMNKALYDLAQYLVNKGLIFEHPLNRGTRAGISAHRKTPLHLARLELYNLKNSIITILDIQDQLYTLKKAIIENQPPPKKPKKIKVLVDKRKKRIPKLKIQQNIILSFD